MVIVPLRPPPPQWPSPSGGRREDMYPQFISYKKNGARTYIQSKLVTRSWIPYISSNWEQDHITTFALRYRASAISITFYVRSMVKQETGEGKNASEDRNNEEKVMQSQQELRGSHDHRARGFSGREAIMMNPTLN